MFSRKLKAAGVALFGFRKGVTFKQKKGRAFFGGLGPHLAKVASLFGYDIRHARNGRIWFQLRDRKAERKAIKRVLSRLKESAP